MRRFMSTVLIALSLLTGTLSLSGCLIAPPRDHGYGHHDDRGRGHDRNHDHDHDRDGNHWH